MSIFVNNISVSYLTFKIFFDVPFFFSVNSFLLVKPMHVLFVKELRLTLLKKIASNSLVIAFEFNISYHSRT